MSEINQLRINLESYLILAGASALPALVLWLTRVRGHPLLPPPRQRLIPWSGFEIFLLIFFLLVFWPTVTNETLSKCGFLDWLYGCNVDPRPGKWYWDPTDVQQLVNGRRLLWLNVAAWPFQVATILLLLRALSNTRPYQLGLSTHRFAQNVILGWVAWCLLTPLVLCCHILVEWAFRRGLHFHSEKHPLQRIIEVGGLPIEWVLIIFSAVVVAPVLEELLFRGSLQQWFARRQWGGYAAMLAALVLTLLIRWDKWEETFFRESWKSFPRELGPVYFVLLMAPGCLFVERAARGRIASPQAARAIYGTALLFAMSHASVWPTPIPLFFLGLGLGYLAYRTQSLVGPILFHALFNAVACVGFLLM